jgi:hypothetical protein
MPHANRVTPFGAFEATPARGLLTGNRGVLHDAEGRIGGVRWRTRRWIACRLAFKGRRRTILTPGRWTELFFLDEAVALAAGHRPCAECRREDYDRFRRAWAAGVPGAEQGLPGADAIDRVLHTARLVPGSRAQRHYAATLGELPPGTFVTLPGRPGEAFLVGATTLRRWSHAGYRESLALPGAAAVEVVTPAPVVAVLAAGYVPLLHPTADGAEAATETTATGPPR